MRRKFYDIDVACDQAFQHGEDRKHVRVACRDVQQYAERRSLTGELRRVAQGRQFVFQPLQQRSAAQLFRRKGQSFGIGSHVVIAQEVDVNAALHLPDQNVYGVDHHADGESRTIQSPVKFLPQFLEFHDIHRIQPPRMVIVIIIIL